MNDENNVEFISNVNAYSAAVVLFELPPKNWSSSLKSLPPVKLASYFKLLTSNSETKSFPEGLHGRVENSV